MSAAAALPAGDVTAPAAAALSLLVVDHRRLVLGHNLDNDTDNDHHHPINAVLNGRVEGCSSSHASVSGDGKGAAADAANAVLVGQEAAFVNKDGGRLW